MKAILFLLLISFNSQILYAQTACNNISPVAIAGNDTIIHNNQTSCITPLPITITLNGSSSFDPDGILVSYLWTGLNGITSPNAAITTVTGLLPGTYTFILKVTDNNGAFAYDTIHISIVPGNRPLIAARLIQIGTLSESRGAVTVGAAGNKLVFAGGSPDGCAIARVDIFDISTGTWTTSQLSQARYGMGVAVLGNKIFFAGGYLPLPGPPGPTCYITNWNNTRSSVVDIYDASTNTWSVAQLSSARSPVGASAGNKVVFAGGDDDYYTAQIDIYDAGSNSWSTSLLSQSRHISQAAIAGNKIFFGGGSIGLYTTSGGNLSKQLDIYDASSNTWSVDTLSFLRGEMGAISANNKIYWGGGYVWDPSINDWGGTNSVEIKDLSTNTTSFDCLSKSKASVFSLSKNNNICFFSASQTIYTPDDMFDIYDFTTNSWSIGFLPQNLTTPVFVSYNNNIYVTEGSQVWKLEIDNCTNNSSSVITASACDTYTLNGKTYVGSGIYTQKLINAVGCDSIITLNLTVNYSTHCTTTITTCDIFTWQGKTYTASGFYSDTLVSSNGCDSILSLFLTINNKTFTTVNAAICTGQNYAGYTIAGTYIDTLLAANSCDSIRTLNLTVKSGSFSTIDTSICRGQSYAGHTVTGIYTDTLTASNGCDSVRTLNLTIKANCNVYIPNAFTPNKDGLNDLFKPTINLAFQQYSFTVFNRYGQKIFETREYGKGWDGSFKGKDQPSGTYVYRIKFTNIFGWESVDNGTVLLIR